VSTAEQDADLQTGELTSAGCYEVFVDHASRGAGPPCAGGPGGSATPVRPSGGRRIAAVAWRRRRSPASTARGSAAQGLVTQSQQDRQHSYDVVPHSIAQGLQGHGTSTPVRRPHASSGPSRGADSSSTSRVPSTRKAGGWGRPNSASRSPASSAVADTRSAGSVATESGTSSSAGRVSASWWGPIAGRCPSYFICPSTPGSLSGSLSPSRMAPTA